MLHSRLVMPPEAILALAFRWQWLQSLLKHDRALAAVPRPSEQVRGHAGLWPSGRSSLDS